MSDIENRFETSDVKTRKRHQVVLTVNSPKSSEKTFANKEMELSVSHVVHVTPSEKALEIKAQREKMRSNRYYIKIKFSKRNSFIGQIDNVPYKNSGVYGDSFIFRAKEISIIAERSSIYDGNAILTNTSNSIFQQTLKALLYCYAVNLSSLQLTSIKISRRTVRKE